MIYDVHVHVADKLTGFRQPLRYGKVLYDGQELQWLPPSFDPPASSPEILIGFMDWAGVDKAFMVQHWQFGDQNDTMLRALRLWPDRLYGFAGLGALDRPDDCDRLERLIEAGMTGLKVEVASTRRLRPGFRFDGEHEWQVWERLNALQRPLILDINVSDQQDVEALPKLFDAFPHIQVLISHVGGPRAAGWEQRAALIEHPRVWTDLAALPGMAGDAEYPYRKAQEMVRWTVERFGADRVMWGTDYPHLMMQGTYRQLLDFVRVHCDFLTAEQRSAILGGTAERFLQAIDS